MTELNPITREEELLDDIATGNTPSLTPLTREEIYLNAIATNGTVDISPMTRKEYFLNKILQSGGGGGGSSDFTTCTMTVVDNDAMFPCCVPCIYDIENAEISGLLSNARAVAGGDSYVIVLYKGFTMLETDCSDVVITGDAEFSDGWISVTGDFTVESWINN